MIALLTRTERRADSTWGVLQIPGGATVYTLEPRWQDNAVGHSCIPAGRYRMMPGTFGQAYVNWELRDVPGRAAIEIHRGNWVEDTTGCILVGLGTGVRRGRPALLRSKDALDLLVASLEGADPVYLEVEWAPGQSP